MQPNKLTKSISGYKEGELPLESQQVFIHLHQQLCEKPLAAHPRPNLVYHLTTDAAAGNEKNPGGFGAVLSKIWEDGTKHVIPYASRAF